MISVSTIKGLLSSGKYDDVWKLMADHFEGPEKLDLVAAGKVLALVNFSFKGSDSLGCCAQGSSSLLLYAQVSTKLYRSEISLCPISLRG